MSRAIEIVEVGPRDGLQSEPGVMPTAAKIEFIRRAMTAGLRRIEVASFVHPLKVPQMADAEAVLLGGPSAAGIPLYVPKSTVTGQWNFEFADLGATVGVPLAYLDGAGGLKFWQLGP